MSFVRTLGTLACLAAAPCAFAGDFTLSSATLADGGTLTSAQVLEGFGCHGGNRSPGLSWKGEPAGTRSFAVTVYDPDAPTGSGWWHWVVIDLPATAHRLAEGAGDTTGKALPAGAVQGRTDYGVPGFGGACPPPGDKPHRYVFTVYALKVPHIDVPKDASAAMIGYMIHANSLGSASMQATYGR